MYRSTGANPAASESLRNTLRPCANGMRGRWVQGMAKQTLKSPWPYEGGKTRWSERIWQAFGDTPDIAPSIYLEPFAGSLAVLLGNPNGPAKREVICDTNPGIANFWRSIQCDPDAVARWADYPTIHHDLTARNAWLAK